MTREELKTRLDGLSPAAVRFVARVVEALSAPPRVAAHPQGTWITRCPDWIEYFGLALSVHHGTTTEPLGLNGFEAVFRNACDSVGWKLDPPGSPTRRFVDLTVRVGTESERRLSLKSTAAQRLSETTAHISKLTEAAWIQDLRTAAEGRRRTLGLPRDYTGTVDAIIMLRAFRERNRRPRRYQLHEIPTTIFRPLQSLPSSAFNAHAPTVDCVVGGETVARVSLDRSDAKITVKSILLTACTVHAEWRVSR